MKNSPSLHRIFCMILVMSVFFFPSTTNAQVVTWNNQVFRIDTLADHLGFPWEVTYGPDDSLWVTEARGYKITKINPRNGGKRTLANLNSLLNFDRSIAQWPQGGLMGMVLHPQLLTGKPYVYVGLVYFRYPNTGSPNNSLCSGTTGNHPCYFRTKILRYTYDPANGTLNNSPDIVLDNLFGSNDHNSGRMAIGPDGKLYYTIGDMGAGQFNNQTRTNNAQNISVYEGKVLRLNLEPDAAQSGGAEWIPDDNPFPVASPVTSRTPVFSYGHRNPQGLIWGNVAGTWRLYSSEHGDKSDDEINIINSGVNYGWPKVSGLCDDNYNTADGNPNNNVLANQTVPNEIVTFCNGNANQQPMFVLFNADSMSIPSSAANIFTWPTIAPSGLDFYGTYPHTIPGWSNSLLVPSLKYGLYRLKLKTPNGDRVDSASTASVTDTIPYFHGNRIRDVAINPNGDTLYFAVDSAGNTSGPTGGFTGGSVATPNAGRILRVVYLQNLPLRDVIPPRPVNNRTYVKVYPNPASKVMYVQSKRGMHKPLRAELLDMTGKLVLQEVTANDNFAIGLEHLNRGMYIFKLYNGYGVLMTTEKVVVQ